LFHFPLDYSFAAILWAVKYLTYFTIVESRILEEEKHVTDIIVYNTKAVGGPLNYKIVDFTFDRRNLK
jgi:hypothetical protein